MAVGRCSRRIMQRNMARVLTIVLFSIALCLEAPYVAPAADPPADPRPKIEQLVDRLADSDFLVRERATEALMLREDFHEMALRRALSADNHPERRNRLIRIAKHRFFQRLASQFAEAPEDRGALGIRLSPDNQTAPTRFVLYDADHRQLPNTAMVIAQTIPGFPAFVHLRPGDQVLQVNGRKLNECLTDTDFVARLAPQRRNQKLKLKVRRGQRVFDVTLAMGSYTQLLNLTYTVQYGGGRPMEGADMFSAYPPWRQYLQRLKKSDSDAPQPVQGL